MGMAVKVKKILAKKVKSYIVLRVLFHFSFLRFLTK
jgi:hypothetical protein